MDAFERFEALAGLARAEPVPRLDVTQRVLWGIRRAERANAFPWVLPVVSGLSAVAAAVVAVLALQAWDVLTDPLVGIFNPLSAVIQ
jgi:hypothetical protein